VSDDIILLDVSVPMYAGDQEHPFKEPVPGSCRRLQKGD